MMNENKKVGIFIVVIALVLLAAMLIYTYGFKKSQNANNVGAAITGPVKDLMADAKTGDLLTIAFTGKLKSGEIFDQTTPEQPFQLTLGGTQVLPAFPPGQRQGVLGRQGGLDPGLRHRLGPDQLRHVQLRRPAGRDPHPEPGGRHGPAGLQDPGDRRVRPRLRGGPLGGPRVAGEELPVRGEEHPGADGRIRPGRQDPAGPVEERRLRHPARPLQPGSPRRDLRSPAPGAEAGRHHLHRDDPQPRAQFLLRRRRW